MDFCDVWMRTRLSGQSKVVSPPSCPVCCTCQTRTCNSVDLRRLFKVLSSLLQKQSVRFVWWQMLRSECLSQSAQEPREASGSHDSFHKDLTEFVRTGSHNSVHLVEHHVHMVVHFHHAQGCVFFAQRRTQGCIVSSRRVSHFNPTGLRVIVGVYEH